MHVHAAVDADRLAGHEVAVIGSEKNHSSEEDLRMLVPLTAAAVAAIGELLRGHDAFLVRARDRQPRHDRIYADIVVSDFARKRAREAEDPGLRGDVMQKQRRSA